ncbi:MAG: accessory regulator AgrB [Anaerosolibacter sp.]|jgi:accessory gene regulator B|uniref:accessory gene regulator ArgB-like protein n=1 Tax=Anaerosolibacter sp. TaxID=1872527 RepID=UPI002623DF22|nr:accessory gene regulator B family protein [Anaerosolibacter sp.]MDF2546786.1 accessory regulator AgrB [Anaerosolibacter sp.]
MIEKLSSSLAAVIAGYLHLDEDNKEVLAYGAFSIFQTIWSVGLVIIFGLLFGVLLEAFTISLVGAILRKSAGGVHATSPNRCAAIGVIMSVGLALLMNMTEINSGIGLSSIFTLVCFLITYYCIIKFSPMDTPNKPIVKAEVRLRLKKASLKTVHICLMITACSYVFFLSSHNYLALSTATAISGGLLTQAVSLTSFGSSIILNLDKMLNSLSIK